MPRRRTIVGIGEAVLAESGDAEEPAGLALRTAIGAMRLGHEGIAISRLGQDATAAVLLAKLREIGVDVGHLQSDPDLATGRLSSRAIGGGASLSAYSAFDNLQWDFDLDDVAQRADAAVFGVLGRRSGQSRSVTDRFLAHCRLAVRVFDFTSRGGGELDRERARSGLEHAEAAVVDGEALRALLPGTAAEGPIARAAVESLLRFGDLSVVLTAVNGEPLAAHTAEGSWAADVAHEPRTHEASVVGFLHGVLAGWSMQASVDFAARVARHLQAHPDQPVPPELLEGAAADR